MFFNCYSFFPILTVTLLIKSSINCRKINLIYNNFNHYNSNSNTTTKTNPKFLTTINKLYSNKKLT